MKNKTLGTARQLPAAVVWLSLPNREGREQRWRLFAMEMLKKERNYDFRKRLLQIHKKDHRDLRLTAHPDELALTDGFRIILPQGYGEVLYIAALDFIDYLFVSMRVSACLSEDTGSTETNSLRLLVDRRFGEENAAGAYRVAVGQDIVLTAGDERGLAQALYYLEDVMNLRRAPFLPRRVVTRQHMFNMRATLSGYGIDLYPDAYLARLAHAGITVIFLWIKDLNETLLGHLDFNELGYRASRYGIDLYITSYAHHQVHPDDEGAQAYYDNMYGRLFAACPYLKGVKILGEACQFSSRDPHVGLAPHTANQIDGIPTGKISPGWWPCTDWPDLVRMIQKAACKVRPDADIILCSYNWGWAPEEERVRLINDLPEDISLMVTWEMFEHYKLGDVDEVCCDYTIRIPGPGAYFLSEAAAATRRGIKVYATANTTGRTWDYGVIPYMP
ncbi:MAG: hypothetical protein GX173_11855, partial [Ruminococcaceae bacterium]|nr:hypothetical protein [Oscillospiraceae bacterium]